MGKKKKTKNKQTKFELLNKKPQCYTNTLMLLLISQKAELLALALAAGDEQQDRSRDPCTAHNTNPDPSDHRELQSHSQEFSVRSPGLGLSPLTCPVQDGDVG